MKSLPDLRVRLTLVVMGCLPLFFVFLIQMVNAAPKLCTPVHEEPEFAQCPVGYVQKPIDTYTGSLQRDEAPQSHSYTFKIHNDTAISLVGWVKEGHPEIGCSPMGGADEDAQCNQSQQYEEVIADVDGLQVGYYRDSDYGPDENAWFPISAWSTSVNSGEHTLTIRHSMEGSGSQSVDYKFTLCRQTGFPIEDGFLVSSPGTDEILLFDGDTGDFIEPFVEQGSGGLDGPIGMAFDVNNNLYVSSFFSNEILQYNGQSGEFIRTFVPAGAGGLANPNHLVFGPDGNLYVVSYGTNQILRYDGTTGAYLGVFASHSLMQGPIGLTFGPNGNLYVTSSLKDSVLRFDGSTGAFIDVFASGGGLDGPTGLVFGPDGNLYVSSTLTYSVLKYDGSTGAFLGEFARHPSLLHPRELLFRSDGNLYVASTNGVYRFDGNTGTFVDVFIPAGSGGLDNPLFIAIPQQPAQASQPPVSLITHEQPASSAALDKTVCVDIHSITDNSLTFSAPAGTWMDQTIFCQVLALNREFIADPAAIGDPDILGMDIISAVDVFAMRADDFTHNAQVCLQGIGDVLYVNTDELPRNPQWLTPVYQAGNSCVTIGARGMVILVAPSSEPLSNPEPSSTLANCRVTTTHMVRLRSQPTTDSQIITNLPWQLTLQATAKQGNWYQVIYLDSQHWVSGDYLTKRGGCS